jgi:uncharacterized membrane protein YkvA (DUF1232 family)
VSPPSQPHPRSRGQTALSSALRPIPNRGRRRHINVAWDVATSAWRFFLDPNASTGLKLLFLLSALYVLTPADLIPDLVPVIGWLDDIGVAALAAAFLLRTIAPYRRRVPPSVVDTTGAEVR